MRLAVGIAALLVSGGQSAQAQDASLVANIDLANIEDVEQLALSDLLEAPISAVSGFAGKPADSPILVSPVDRDTIERLGYRTLNDVLQGMRGMYVANDRNYSYVGARGFGLLGDYNTRFALAIDGHRMNDAVYAQAPTGLELGLPMIAVDRVELVRGGAWLVHGENALLGAIQVITATGASQPGIHVTSTTRASVETFDDAAGRSAFAPRGQDVAASYGAVEHGVHVFVAASYINDPGLRRLYFPELATPDEVCVDRALVRRACDGIVDGNDGEEVGSAYASISTRGLTLHVLAARRVKDVATASFGTLIGAPLVTYDNRAFADLSYRHSTHAFDLIARIAADAYLYRGTYPYSGSSAAAVDGVGAYDTQESGDATSVTGELRTRYRRATLGKHVRDVEVALGVESVIANAGQFNVEHLPEGDNVYLDRDDRDHRLSAFGYASARVVERVVTFAAVRGDYHPDGFGTAINPQFGLELDGGTLGRIRASLASGYRAPTIYERFYSVGPGEQAVALDKETSTTRELSLERYLGEHVRLLVVGFQQDLDDLIGLSESDDGIGVFQNRGGMKSYGLETELEGRWDRLRFRASYSRSHTRTDDGTVPANSPRSLANMMLLAPLAGGRAEVGVSTFYVNERASFDGTVLPPNFITNVVLTVHDVVKSLDLSAGISNAFDQRSGDPGSEEHRQSSIPHDPRTLWLRLGVRLGS